MKKVMVLTFLFAMVLGTVNATVVTNKKEIIGEWKYKVPTAPYGYEAGTMVISEKEGKLSGQVKFTDGYKIDLKKITFAEGVFKCGLYVDYEYITLKAKVNGKKMNGVVNTPDGEMKITAEKVK